MEKFFLAVLFLLPLVVPSLAFAQAPTPIVTCGNEYYTKAEQTSAENAIKDAIKANKSLIPKMVFEGEVKNPCEFKDIIGMSQRIINYLIKLGVIIATLGFAYAGYLYITAAGSMESIKHAHSIFVKVLIGFALMLGAWLIAKAFESVFLNPAAQERSFLK